MPGRGTEEKGRDAAGKHCCCWRWGGEFVVRNDAQK